MSKPLARLVTFALSAAILTGLAGSASAQAHPRLVNACSDAAHQYFENWDATTNMRADEPRVDGTRTAGGTIDLANYVAEIRCAFAPKALRLIEFYVDGVDKLADLQSGRTVNN